MTAAPGEAEDRPLVSIIIPTYNRAELAVATVVSCLEQTYEPCEVVVIDDGSSDDTLAVLRQTFAAHPCVRLAGQPNAGPSAARNHGLRLARGEFVKFMDSDDTLEPDAIGHYIAALQETGADLCIGGRRYMSFEGEKWRVNYEPPEGLIDRPLAQFFDLGIRPQQGLWCFRRRVFRQRPGEPASPGDAGLEWDESLHSREDVDLLARLLAGGASVCGAPRAIMNQRAHPGPRVSARQFEPDVFAQVHQSNERLLELMKNGGTLAEAGRAYSRSLVRTAVRLYPTDRTLARDCANLARRAHRRTELVLLPLYGRGTRLAAYALWKLGGLPLCGRVMAWRTRDERSAPT